MEAWVEPGTPEPVRKAGEQQIGSTDTSVALQNREAMFRRDDRQMNSL
jgi:hypothetical protein